MMHELHSAAASSRINFALLRRCAACITDIIRLQRMNASLQNCQFILYRLQTGRIQTSTLFDIISKKRSSTYSIRYKNREEKMVEDYHMRS